MTFDFLHDQAGDLGEMRTEIADAVHAEWSHFPIKEMLTRARSMRPEARGGWVEEMTARWWRPRLQKIVSKYQGDVRRRAMGYAQHMISQLL